MIPSRTFATLLFVGASLATFSARGEEPATLTLTSWSAPKDCPAQTEVEQRMRDKLPAGAQAEARAHVEKNKQRFKLTLEIASRGERVLEADTCDAVIASAAVVLAMSHAPEREKEEETGPPPKEEPKAPIVTAITNEPEKEAPKPPPVHTARSLFGARAEGAIDVGLLPTATFGGGIAFGIDPIERLHVEIGGALYASQEATLANDTSRGATFRLLSGAARGCYSFTRRIEIGPCLGAEVVSLSANGFGAARVANATSTTWGPEAMAYALVPIAGPISLRAGAGAFFPLSRQSFVITSQGTVHRADAAAFRAFLGPEVRF